MSKSHIKSDIRTVLKGFLLKILFLVMWGCPQKPGQGVGSLGAGVIGNVSHMTWVVRTELRSLWKSSMCSFPLSHLSRPIFVFSDTVSHAVHFSFKLAIYPSLALIFVFLPPPPNY